MPSQYTLILGVVAIVLTCVVLARWIATAYDNHYRNAAEKHDYVWSNDPTGNSARQWYERHPKPIRVSTPNVRHQRIKTNGGTHTSAEWEALQRKYKRKCLCCKQVKPLTKDHVIPVISGGTDSIDNIQPLCQQCNSRKGTRTVDYR